MNKTPKVSRGCKASPVKVTKADGSVKMQAAYDLNQFRRVVGIGKDAVPGKPDAAKSPPASKIKGKPRNFRMKSTQKKRS